MAEHKMKVLDGVRYRPEDAPQEQPQQSSTSAAQPAEEGTRSRRTRSSTRSRGDAGDHDSE